MKYAGGSGSSKTCQTSIQVNGARMSSLLSLIEHMFSLCPAYCKLLSHPVL